MDGHQWLTHEERRAWIAFVGVLVKLPYALDVDCKQRSRISHFEYLVLSAISEAPHRSIPMKELATLANASLSRLSHVVARMEERGFVRRQPCPGNGRVTNATLTEEGMEVVEDTAPGHVTAVRSLVFEALTPDQVTQLDDICHAMLRRIDPEGEWPPRSTRH